MTEPGLMRHIKQLGLRDYSETLAAMQRYTATRGPKTPDMLWLVEHPPVFTLGQAGKHEHLLNPGQIPVIQSDRGGQVTYHGPGQAIFYILLDLHRHGIGIRKLVTLLEQSTIALLSHYGITSHANKEAPGVYVDGRKIAALGIRVRHGCCYHGLSLNIDMDLGPFTRINPCGYADLEVTQLSELGITRTLSEVQNDMARQLATTLNACRTPVNSS